MLTDIDEKTFWSFPIENTLEPCAVMCMLCCCNSRSRCVLRCCLQPIASANSRRIASAAATPGPTRARFRPPASSACSSALIDGVAAIGCVEWSEAVKSEQIYIELCHLVELGVKFIKQLFCGMHYEQTGWLLLFSPPLPFTITLSQSIVTYDEVGGGGGQRNLCDPMIHEFV